MESSLTVAEVWRARSESSPSPQRPSRDTMGFSHIKRAFLSDLVQGEEQSENAMQVLLIAQGLAKVVPSPEAHIPSDDDDGDDDDDDVVASDVESADIIEDAVVLPRSEVIVPPERDWRWWGIQRYSAVAVSALSGAAIASSMKRGLGPIIRVLGSGLLVTQLLCSFGYADVYWKCLLKDIWRIGERRPENGLFAAVFDIVAGSFGRKLALLCGFAGGLFIS
ncbi:hypothetical protein DQ04_00271180 [Trypanosoma grayi]|uniref:hypothetical protein n=1 Tax=Trypanosoma grayi TaxID=71804 RepID=UPI0004F48369|nr:hypothetical protein DQ04_00271180 [Trypanosoma grayi]KEG14884.1 hypothetical protein DQ04_00271180 [Trypanosoma grayi]